MTDNNSHRFGFITVSGPANVGKSTLLNALVGHKIAITSRRPQTTRHRILGVKTMPHAQLVFVDTPGIHLDQEKALNRAINRTAVSSLEGVDLVLFMIDHNGWSNRLDRIFDRVRGCGQAIVLVINKIDRLKQKQQLLPLIAAAQKQYNFAAIVPVSAKTSENLPHLVSFIEQQLPYGPAGFPSDQITDKSMSFQASELIREQVFRALGQELPYQSAVEITHMKTDDNGLLRIEALIWVERNGQKSIVIGNGGAQLQSIGKQARVQMEKLFACRVYLDLWVKVRKGWAENTVMLRSFGYIED